MKIERIIVISKTEGDNIWSVSVNNTESANNRASQNFEKEDRVHDCARFHDFSRKNRMLPFIS